MKRPSIVPGALKPLRIGSGLLLCSCGALILALVGRPYAAVGVAMGFALYLVNLLLMAETARSLLETGTRQRIGIVTGLSSVGRLLFLGVVLAVVAIFLGRETVLGACGGLLIAQVNLHVWGRTARRWVDV
jgi:hypothetical protein